MNNEISNKLNIQNQENTKIIRFKNNPPQAEIKEIIKDPDKIYYYFYNSPIGKTLIGSTDNYLVYYGFIDDLILKENYINEIKTIFPKSHLEKSENKTLFYYKKIFNPKINEKIPTGIKGSDFFIKVLKELCKTKNFELLSYKELAENAGFKNASRAVGTAMKNNPVAYVIPCHRVIKSSGEPGFYSSGPDRKKALILREKNISFFKKNI
ncbi:MAG: methylated-DNA--[protein]-cysteine S-methyltransferase [Thermodesulfobacteriota bacterium]